MYNPTYKNLVGTTVRNVFVLSTFGVSRPGSSLFNCECLDCGRKIQFTERQLSIGQVYCSCPSVKPKTALKVVDKIPAKQDNEAVNLKIDSKKGIIDKCVKIASGLEPSKTEAQSRKMFSNYFSRGGVGSEFSNKRLGLSPEDAVADCLGSSGSRSSNKGIVEEFMKLNPDNKYTYEVISHAVSSLKYRMGDKPFDEEVFLQKLKKHLSRGVAYKDKRGKNDSIIDRLTSRYDCSKFNIIVIRKYIYNDQQRMGLNFFDDPGSIDYLYNRLSKKYFGDQGSGAVKPAEVIVEVVKPAIQKAGLSTREKLEMIIIKKELLNNQDLIDDLKAITSTKEELVSMIHEAFEGRYSNESINKYLA